jgi:hypothetical protein
MKKSGIGFNRLQRCEAMLSIAKVWIFTRGGERNLSYFYIIPATTIQVEIENIFKLFWAALNNN